MKEAFFFLVGAGRENTVVVSCVKTDSLFFVLFGSVWLTLEGVFFSQEGAPLATSLPHARYVCLEGAGKN